MYVWSFVGAMLCVCPQAKKWVEHVSCVEGERGQCQWVACGCVGAKYVTEMNMKPYLPWLLVVKGQMKGSRVCVQEEGCCTIDLVKWYGGVNGQLKERVWITCVLLYCSGMSFPFW